MDILSSTFRDLVQWVGGLSASNISLIFRLLLVFGLPAACCAYTFRLGCRSQFTQVLSLTCGLLAAFLIPLGILARLAPVVMTCLVTFAVLAILGIPFFLPFFLFARLDRQTLLQKGLFAFLMAVVLMHGCSRLAGA